MHIAIIGGGITGLTAAYGLTKRGAKVTLFEKDTTLGGLASGFLNPSWSWPLEKTYHHFFTSDQAIIALAKELGMEKDLMILHPTTSVYWNNNQYPFDTPANILKFPGLPFIDRLRTGMTAAIMKLNPFWKPLEQITAKQLFKKLNGNAAWKTIWEPLLDAKFSLYANDIAASWLWGRIYKRTPHLGYFRGGFSHFVDVLAESIKKQGGEICIKHQVSSIKQGKNYQLSINNYQFDKVLITTPSTVAQKIIHFPEDYNKRLSSIPHLWAQTLILETDRPILKKTYWLNINDRSYPFIAVVQHTNFIDKKHYGGRHIAYIGNYLPDNHPYLKLTKEQLIKKFTPYLKKINPSINHELSTMNSFLFTSPNAQPVHTVNYSKRAPKLETPIPHVYIANLDSIYPWDRETNYAVELGMNAAKKILSFDNP